MLSSGQVDWLCDAEGKKTLLHQAAIYGNIVVIGMRNESFSVSFSTVYHGLLL